MLEYLPQPWVSDGGWFHPYATLARRGSTFTILYTREECYIYEGVLVSRWIENEILLYQADGQIRRCSLTPQGAVSEQVLGRPDVAPRKFLYLFPSEEVVFLGVDGYTYLLHDQLLRRLPYKRERLTYQLPYASSSRETQFFQILIR